MSALSTTVLLLLPMLLALGSSSAEIQPQREQSPHRDSAQARTAQQQHVTDSSSYAGGTTTRAYKDVFGRNIAVVDYTADEHTPHCPACHCNPPPCPEAPPCSCPPPKCQCHCAPTECNCHPAPASCVCPQCPATTFPRIPACPAQDCDCNTNCDCPQLCDNDFPFLPSTCECNCEPTVDCPAQTCNCDQDITNNVDCSWPFDLLNCPPATEYCDAQCLRFDSILHCGSCGRTCEAGAESCEPLPAARLFPPLPTDVVSNQTTTTDATAGEANQTADATAPQTPVGIAANTNTQHDTSAAASANYKGEEVDDDPYADAPSRRRSLKQQLEDAAAIADNLNTTMVTDAASGNATASPTVGNATSNGTGLPAVLGLLPNNNSLAISQADTNFQCCRRLGSTCSVGGVPCCGEYTCRSELGTYLCGV